VTLSLVTVGTGTVVPHATRSSPAHWVEAGEARVLMDCGAGTIHALARLGLPWERITHVAISHFHADHIGELPALLFAMQYGTPTPRSAPLAILGPAGLGARLDRLAAAFGPWVTAPDWPQSVGEVLPGRSLELATGVMLAAHRTPHTEESLAFEIATDTGRLVYTGDTGPSEMLADWARGCDVLLAECSLPEDQALAMHLTPRQAGALAARAQAKTLVLTHLYPPVEAVDIVAEAASAYGGPIVVARDGDRFTVGG
jgi:ribonuclease BN (tRNA processing enzyme)